MNVRSYPINQFAPIYQAGVMTPKPEECGYEDKFFEYVFEPPNDGHLDVDQLLENQALEIDQDADFYITGWYLAHVDDNFMVHVVDSYGYELTDGFVLASSISYDSSNPSPLCPTHPVPKGSTLYFTVRNIAATANHLMLVLTGYKRFRRASTEE